jgi:hypothetical protein
MSIDPRPLALALPILLAVLRAAQAAGCAPPQPPGHLAQQQTLDGATIRAVEFPASRTPPRLAILGPDCRTLLSPALAAPSPEQAGQEPAPNLLHFRVVRLRGLPQPLIIAVNASPGGSDTVFLTDLISSQNGQFRPLLDTPLQSTIEGGMLVAVLGRATGSGIALWDMVWGTWSGGHGLGDMVWGPAASRIDPHRFERRRFVWNNAESRPLPTLTTRGRYQQATAALRALGVAYPDLTLTFPAFTPYR